MGSKARTLPEGTSVSLGSTRPPVAPQPVGTGCGQHSSSRLPDTPRECREERISTRFVLLALPLLLVIGTLSAAAQAATALTVAASLATAAPGETFELQVSGVDANGDVEAGYALSGSAMVTASTGTVAVLSTSALSLSVSLSGAPYGTLVTLTVADGSLSGSVAVVVGTVATRLSVVATPTTVMNGEIFELQVLGVDAQGNVDTRYAPSTSAQVTVSTGTVAWLPRAGSGFAVELYLAPDGATVTLTVADGSLSGAAAVTVDVVGTRLSVSGPTTAVSGKTLELQVSAVDHAGNVDTDYSLSEASAVTASTGTVAVLSGVGGLMVSLSGVADGTSVTLTVTDGALSGEVSVVVDVVLTKWVVLGPTTVVSGNGFTLQALPVDAAGSVDLNPNANMVWLVPQVTQGVATIAVQVRHGLIFEGQVSTAEDGSVVECRAIDYNHTDSPVELFVTPLHIVRVDVVATRLAVTASPTTVVPGAAFELQVSAVDAQGDVDADYTLSSSEEVVESSTGTLTVLSQTTGTLAVSLSASLSGAPHRTPVTLTVTDGSLSGSVTVSTVAAHLSVAASPTTVVAGEPFELQIASMDAQGDVDTGYALSGAVVVTASTGTVTVLSTSALSLSVSLSGAPYGTSVTLTVADGVLLGAAVVVVGTVATRLSVVAAPAIVDQNTLIMLQVSGVDAQGNVDARYELSGEAQVTASAGMLTWLLQPGGTFIAALHQISAGETITLTVTDGSLSGEATVTVKVVATRLSVSGPTTAVSGEAFELRVSAVDAQGAVDIGYALSGAATVTASAGTVAVLSRTSSGLTVSLSETPDGASVMLMVEDLALSGSVVVTVDVVGVRLALEPLFSSPVLTVRSADGGAAIDYSLRVENSAGDVDRDVDFSQVTADLLAVSVDRGALVAPATFSPSSGGQHIGSLSLRYWPQSDGDSFELTVAVAQLAFEAAVTTGPVIDVAAERLAAAVVMASTRTDDIHLEHGRSERLTLRVMAVGGEAGCDREAGVVFPCVIDLDGHYAFEWLYDSAASNNVAQAEISTGTSVIQPGAMMAEVVLEAAATLSVVTELVGAIVISVRVVDSSGLAPATASVSLRFDVDLDIDGSDAEDGVDGEILLRYFALPQFLLAALPELLVHDLPGAQGLDATAVLQRVQAMAPFVDVSNDGESGLDDGLLIARFPQFTAEQLRENPEWALLGLPLRLEEVMPRLLAIY